MMTVRRHSSAGNKDDSLSLQSLGNCTLSVSKGKKVGAEEKLRLNLSSPMRVHVSKLHYFNTETCHLPLEGYMENNCLPPKEGMRTLLNWH